MKNKKITSLLLASVTVLSVSNSSFARPAFMYSYVTGIAYKIDGLVDMKPKHWAYGAVKYVVEDLNIMDPETPTRFLGDKKATRYQLAKAFYNAAKGLEDISEKDLRLNKASLDNTLTDVNDDNKKVVNSVVNEYGIMQLLPDSRFMGGREMTRYELAFDMNNYLLLLEKKIGIAETLARDRAVELKDLTTDHWAYAASKNIVDKYKIMDGYPQGVFGGDQKLTRYEVAALIKRFVEYVDKNILSIPKPTPTPTPTIVPTPVPTEIPTPIPTVTPIPKKPESLADLKAGGVIANLFNPSANNSFNKFDPGLNLDASFWFERFGFSVNGEYLFSDDKAFQNSPRVNAGGTVNMKLLGYTSDEDLAVIVGLGYNYTSWISGSIMAGSGPKAKFEVEYPINQWVALNLREDFTIYVAGNTGWKNDVFAGVTIPASNLFSIQLGYYGSQYSVSNVSSFNTQNGLQGFLRFRF
ncbi:MAG: S-layer homology domain-containing protein [Candidatus Sericytochromatia bacterium]|nr:S-layer homology domain-containing protein [Candidatus Sericytochromatia bacterium]